MPEQAPKWLPRGSPWAMRLHKPLLDMRALIGPASVETLRIVQTAENLSENLDRLPHYWQPDTIIHNDIKSDNLLILPPELGKATGLGEVRIVDWEMVQVGDPAWDVAGALQDFVHFWLHSMDYSLDAREIESSARFSKQTVQQAVRAFWNGYRSEAALKSSEERGLLLRAVRYSAARLIQTAYELAQSMGVLLKQAVLLLQVSVNILSDPRSAQEQLYGLP